MEFIEDEEPYEEEEPLEEDPHDENAGGDPGDISPYPDSSSHGYGHPKTQEEDTLESEPSTESPASY